MEIPREGGPTGRNFRRGGDWLLEVFLPGAPHKTGELSKTNSLAVEQASDYCTVNGRKIIIVFIDDILLTVG